jgi:hypothetical protein
MHDIGLSARVAGATSCSSASAAAAAGDGGDESKTRKAHPGFVAAAAAYTRLHSSHRAVVSLLLLLTVAVAAFLCGRARPSVDCAPPRLDTRFLALPDAAAASDFGSLGVPWCKHSRRCCFLPFTFGERERDRVASFKHSGSSSCFANLTDSSGKK